MTEADTEAVGFADLGLRQELCDALATLGYEEPTPIQRKTIPLLLEGSDLVGQAATGTGKTAAFALPILDSIDPHGPAAPSALIVVPTRELAIQVSEAVFKYGSNQGVQVVPVYGGQPIHRQLQALRRGVHVVVGTPGRAIDHIKRGSLKLDGIRTVVLDEADEMLDMGFTEDIETILEATPSERQTVMFSATMPPRIEAITKRYQRDPLRIKVGAGKAEAGKALVHQTAYIVSRAHKASALGRVLDIEGPSSAIVFCRTRTEVDELTQTMNGRGYRAEALHGGMDQHQRDRVMGRLRDGTAEVLIATDVAARGLDVDTLTHVVNYDVPSAAESYVHRIGRVGRAGRTGVAITLAEPRQRRLLGNIERLTKQTIEVRRVPSVADLRTRQIDVTVDAVRQALNADDLADYDAVLDQLDPDLDPRDIARAAIKLFHHERGATTDEVEIPDASERHPKQKGKGKNRDWDNDKPGKGKGKGKSKFDKGKDDKSKFDKGEFGKGKFDKGKGKPGKSKDKGRRGDDDEPGLVFVGLGRNAGVRPSDLVGAIANETGLAGREIGPIRISENHSVVGVPEDSVDTVVSAILNTTIRGKRARARPYVD